MSLMEHLPPYYRTVTEMASLLASEDVELAALREAMGGVMAVGLIAEAPEAVVAELEARIGLIAGGTLAQRRMALLARVRSQGELDRQRLYDVIAAFTGADRSAFVDFTGGTLRVRVLPSPGGEVYLYEEIEKALRPLVPAHIALEMQRYYSTWADVRGAASDWNALGSSFDDWNTIYALIPEVE